MLNYIPEFIDVLTKDGWKEVQSLKISKVGNVLKINEDNKIEFLPIKGISKYAYEGPLLEIYTETCCTYLKPSSFVLCKDGLVKGKDLKKGDYLKRYHEGHKILRLKEVLWKGTLYNLSFNDDYFLPVKFKDDYYLIK
jgi:hypothetical protein